MTKRIPAYLQAQTEIKRFIEVRKLQRGDALPPEATLASELGISRPSLREGLKALQSLGIVESRHGEGVFVAAFSFDAIIENLPYAIVADGNNLADLLQVRAAIELGSLGQVVDFIGHEDKKKLRELATRMLSAARENHTFAQEDGEFHATMYRCLNNAFLSRLVALFWQVFQRLNPENTHKDSASLVESAMDHLRVVEMIEKGDKDGLFDAHRKHFQAVFERLNLTPSVLSVYEKPKERLPLESVGFLDLNGKLDRLVL